MGRVDHGCPTVDHSSNQPIALVPVDQRLGRWLAEDNDRLVGIELLAGACTGLGCNVSRGAESLLIAFACGRQGWRGRDYSCGS
jgi:hypothetical protein